MRNTPQPNTAPSNTVSIERTAIIGSLGPNVVNLDEVGKLAKEQRELQEKNKKPESPQQIRSRFYEMKDGLAETQRRANEAEGRANSAAGAVKHLQQELAALQSIKERETNKFALKKIDEKITACELNLLNAQEHTKRMQKLSAQYKQAIKNFPYDEMNKLAGIVNQMNEDEYVLKNGGLPERPLVVNGRVGFSR
jgi:hypothetical protein